MDRLLPTQALENIICAVAQLPLVLSFSEEGNA